MSPTLEAAAVTAIEDEAITDSDAVSNGRNGNSERQDERHDGERHDEETAVASDATEHHDGPGHNGSHRIKRKAKQPAAKRKTTRQIVVQGSDPGLENGSPATGNGKKTETKRKGGTQTKGASEAKGVGEDEADNTIWTIRLLPASQIGPNPFQPREEFDEEELEELAASVKDSAVRTLACMTTTSVALRTLCNAIYGRWRFSCCISVRHETALLKVTEYSDKIGAS